MPLPAGAQSAVVDHDDQPIWSEPSLTSARRGAAVLGARLPLFAAKRADGCTARWISVGPEAWICQDALHFDGAPPIVPRAPVESRAPGGLPYRYYFVGPGGSNGYARLSDAGEVAPDAELQPGFAVAVVDEGVKAGARYLKTRHGLWVPASDLGAVEPFSFHGVEVSDGKLASAWVLADNPVVFASATPPRPAKGAARYRHQQVVQVLEEVPSKAGAYVRVADGAWLRARDLQRPVVAPRPAAVAPGERWIDVDLAAQTLVAYEGDRPVFATLVSTGKGRSTRSDCSHSRDRICPPDGRRSRRRRQSLGHSSECGERGPSRSSIDSGQLAPGSLRRAVVAQSLMMPCRRNAMTNANKTSDSMRARPRIIGV